MIYAQINKDGYCLALSSLNDKVIQDNLIDIDSFDYAYINRRYDIENKVWTEEYLEIQNYIDKEEPKSKPEILEDKITFIDNYKHDVARNFPYGNCGGIQKFYTDDIALINLTIEGMEMGMTPVEWKYQGDLYDVVIDVNYLKNMKLVGGTRISKAFSVEKVILAELKAIETIEELQEYDEKARFDELFTQEGVV